VTEIHLDFVSHSLDQTLAAGAALGKRLAPGDVICLSGDLGAGKTALMGGIGRGWGALEPINSPTFVLIHEHHRAADSVRLYHLDCYRLSSEADAASIGLEDLLTGNDVVVMEWPERVESLLPVERLWIELETLDETTRRLTITGSGPRYETLIKEWGHVVSY